MKLYNNNFSPNAKRVRVAAKELGITLDVHELDFMKGDNKTPEYMAKNPMGKIPTLEHDGYVVWESPAILFYMSTNSGDKLQPKDVKAKTDMFRWMFWNATHYESGIFTLAFENMIKPKMLKQETDKARVATAQKDLERFAPVLNAHLEGKQWLCGNELSLADIAVGTTTEIGTNCGFDLKPYTHIAAWLKRLQDRPSWK
jgi:glutathione S-transferase